MKKTLVIMRHGKAMPPAQGESDVDRSLTGAGISALSERLPHLLRLLETGNEDVQIWTSPAKRARQTAKLLRKALRKRRVAAKKIEPHDCLWEQDIDGFLDDLSASKAGLIFVVGHVPFAEEIVESLAGQSPSFSTGALCCLDVSLAGEEENPDAPARGDARLLWFAQGPVSADWNTLIQLQATCTEIAEKIEDRRKAFFATPEDIETIHRFRTNTRTLRSLIAFIKPWQNAEQNAETQTILRDIVRYTSRLRELDVLVEQVRADQDASSKLLAFCEKEAAKERAKVLKVLSSKKVSKLFARAMSSVKDIAWKKRFVKHGLPQSVVRARFDAMIESVSADLDALDLSDAERTHDVRKRAKRARYVAEHSNGILGADAVEIAEGMNAHQDSLGEVCDARANIRLIDEFLLQNPPKAVVRDLARIRAQNVDFLRDVLKVGEAKE